MRFVVVVVVVPFLVACGASSASNDAAMIDDAAIEAMTDASSDAGAPYCTPQIGVVQPLSACSASDPCTHNLAGQPPTIAAPSFVPTCKTSTQANHPMFADAAPMSSVDAQGTSRYACLFTPSGATPSSKRPLLVFFHGSGGSADDVYNYTSLRAKAVAFDLVGDGTAGFLLLSVAARNLHWPGTAPEDGPKEDTYHRDLKSPSKNLDVANFDRLVDELVATNIVDTKRIFVSGWSNGGRFAQMIAIARHDTPTPGGNRVAAAAVYSATDPFSNTGKAQVPSCQLDPYPKSSVGIALFGRNCDALPCDTAQGASLTMQGFDIEPGDVMGEWASDLATKVGAQAQRTIVDQSGATMTSCAPSCAKGQALLNHVRWPDGIADKGGIDHEPEMLTFLRMHAL